MYNFVLIFKGRMQEKSGVTVISTNLPMVVSSVHVVVLTSSPLFKYVATFPISQWEMKI